MSEWTVARILRQSERGGVNRQEVMLLVCRIRQLEEGIRRHRDVHQAEADLVGAVPDSDDLTLWKLLEGDDDG